MKRTAIFILIVVAFSGCTASRMENKEISPKHISTSSHLCSGMTNAEGVCAEGRNARVLKGATLHLSGDKSYQDPIEILIDLTASSNQQMILKVNQSYLLLVDGTRILRAFLPQEDNFIVQTSEPGGDVSLVGSTNLFMGWLESEGLKISVPDIGGEEAGLSWMLRKNAPCRIRLLFLHSSIGDIKALSLPGFGSFALPERPSNE